MSAVDFISKQLMKRVYLIGIRALYEQGVPIYRGTEGIDLYSPISVEERDELGKFLRKRLQEQQSTGESLEQRSSSPRVTSST